MIRLIRRWLQAFAVQQYQDHHEQGDSFWRILP